MVLEISKSGRMLCRLVLTGIYPHNDYPFLSGSNAFKTTVSLNTLYRSADHCTDASNCYFSFFRNCPIVISYRLLPWQIFRDVAHLRLSRVSLSVRQFFPRTNLECFDDFVFLKICN